MPIWATSGTVLKTPYWLRCSADRKLTGIGASGHAEGVPASRSAGGALGYQQRSGQMINVTDYVVNCASLTPVMITCREGRSA